MMHDSRDMLEKPLMWAIINVEYLLCFSSSEATPALRYDCTYAKGLNGIEKQICQSFRIINNNTAKANIYNWRSRPSQKGVEFSRWRVFDWVTEEKAAYVFTLLVYHKKWFEFVHTDM
jgi:hypothetical protein